MKDATKYLKIVENTFNGNLPMIKTSTEMFKIAMKVVMGFHGTYGVGTETWKRLGQPPAQYVNNDALEGYLIDLGDTKTLGALLAMACHNTVQAGCFAATDISDAINAINNDNLDGRLTDKEAVEAMRQVVVSGMATYQDLHRRAEESLKER